MVQRETKLKEIVQADLKTLERSWFYKTQEVAVHGIPDIILCLGGYFFALELKSDDGATAEPLQEYVLEKIKKAGGQTFLVTPGNWHQIFEVLREFVSRL